MKKMMTLMAVFALVLALAPAAQAQWTTNVFVNPGTALTMMGNWDIDVSNGIGIAAPNDKSKTFADKPILFNTADATLLRRLNPTTAFTGNNVMGAAIDGGLAVVGEQSVQFVLFNVATGNELGRVTNAFGNSGFGSSAAISGTTVAIGGWDGKVRVFDVSPLVNSTGPATLLGDVPSSGNFGFALSGNTLVSASGGTVNYYTVGATSIGAGTALTTPATAGSFGSSVDIDGNMVIVGAIGTTIDGTINAGSAYLFDLSVSNASQATITPTAPVLQDRGFGYDVGISGDTAIVASRIRYALPQYSKPGEAYLFDITNPAAITQIQAMGTGKTLADDRYGYEGGVAIDGNYAVVSASRYDIPGGNSDVGAAYIYTGPATAAPPGTLIVIR